MAVFRANGLAIACAICACVTFLLGVLLGQNIKFFPSETPSTASSAYAVYVNAIAEPDPALRRARLLDFIDTYPNHPRRAAAKAQEQVLSKYEAEDWAKATHIVFDDYKSYEDKVAALDSFTARWSPDILGGRAEEVAHIQTRISDEKDRRPSLANEIAPTKPEAGSDSMAGGPFTGAQLASIVQSNSFETPYNSRNTVNYAEMVEATVLREGRVRYPSRAAYREIEGIVDLRLYIDARGRVHTTELISVQAPRYAQDFIRAAERAAMGTRYNPARKGGQAVESDIEKRYRFVLD